MVMKKDLVKQNINLLEYPLWFQDERKAETDQGITWADREGYVFRAGYKIPVKTDGIFLLYLLLQSQRNSYAGELTLTRYQVIRDCGLVLSRVWYDRLEDSLERWKMVGIKFEGTFYDGEHYQAMNFGVIDSWRIDEETKNLKIRFSPEFLRMMLGKGFFKYINFSEFKQLHSPLATRLYELLSKSFHGRQAWEIEVVKLADKIPMKERFPAHIVPKIKTAVARINKNTELKISVRTRKADQGETIFIFEKTAVTAPADNSSILPTTPAGQPDLPFGLESPPSLNDNDEIQNIIKFLPIERQGQKSLRDAVQEAYARYGFDYVSWNIKYANKHAKGNYPAYLLKSLKGNYGQALREEDEIRQSVARNLSKLEQQKHAERKHMQDQDARDTELAQTYLDSMNAEDRLKLEEEALATFPPFLRARIEKADRKSVSFQAVLRGMALERIKERQAAAIEAPE